MMTHSFGKLRPLLLSLLASICLMLVFSFPAGSASAATPSSSWYSSSHHWSGDEPPNKRPSTKREVPTSDLAPFAPESNNFALDLGQVFLMGELGHYANSIGTQIHYTYGVSELFAFDASLGYSEHSNGQLSMTSLLTGLRANLSWFDKIVPYALLGLGFYRPSYHFPALSAQSGLTDASGTSLASLLFGVHVGPGIDLQLSRNLFFGASLTLHNLFGTTETLPNGTPFSVSGAYTTFFVHTGVTF